MDLVMFLGAWIALGVASSLSMVWLKYRAIKMKGAIFGITVNQVLGLMLVGLLGPVATIVLIRDVLDQYGSVLVVKKDFSE